MDIHIGFSQYIPKEKVCGGLVEIMKIQAKAWEEKKNERKTEG